MARNEKTSSRIAKIAAKVLAVRAKHGRIDLVSTDDRFWLDIEWSQIRALAASALTQAADSKSSRKRITDNTAAKQRHLVRVKAEGFDRVLTGPVELMKPKRRSK